MVILITGITSGFGKAMAEILSKEGHSVYGTHRREAERIPGVTYIKAEATDQEQVDAAVKKVLDAEGRIDVFINNAGMGIGGPLEFSPVEDAQRQMDVNFMGMVRFLHRILPVMRAQKSGRIICFSSIAGRLGIPFQGFYSASKFAIEGYCETLRCELRGTGIDVVVVEPGDFATGFTAARKKVEDPAAYEAYPSYKSVIEGMENDERTGLKPEYLARKVSKIVNCRRPRYTYVISTFVQGVSIPLKTILPPRLWAKIFASFYNL